MSIFLLASWLDAALVSVLPFFWQRGTDDEPCVYDPTREWSLMVITTNVFTPFLIMLFCHVYTVTFALRYSRRRKIHLMERGTNATSSKYSWQSSTTSRNTTGQKKNAKLRALWDWWSVHSLFVGVLQPFIISLEWCARSASSHRSKKSSQS